MSTIDCEDPNHERCGGCGGCTTCGCLCHLAAEAVEAQQQPDRQGLIHIEFGLQPFTPEPMCPKCRSEGVQVTYHSLVIMNVGQGEYPCGSWYRSKILTGEVSEHLCLRCMRCHYGWPTKTADTPGDFSEDPLAQGEGT